MLPINKLLLLLILWNAPQTNVLLLVRSVLTSEHSISVRITAIDFKYLSKRLCLFQYDFEGVRDILIVIGLRVLQQFNEFHNKDHGILIIFTLHEWEYNK